MLNSVVIQGRLTKPPETRFTQSQKPVASFTLAVDRDFGEKETDFVSCVAWNKTAEFVQKYLDKGSMAIVTGRLQSRDWTDKEGQKRKSWEVVVDHVYFGESKKETKTASVFEEIDGEIDGDLPF